MLTYYTILYITKLTPFCNVCIYFCSCLIILNNALITCSGLQNDHKAIMAEIEEALHKLHAREKAKRECDEAEAQEEAMEQQVTPPPPFARVDAVTQGSPASGAVRHELILCSVVSLRYHHKSFCDFWSVIVCFLFLQILVSCSCFQGLRVGDEVIEFGSVNTGNFQNLQNIAAVVQHSDGVSYKCELSAGQNKTKQFVVQTNTK